MANSSRSVEDTMSKQLVLGATLENLPGPFYPDALYTLHDLVYESKIAGSGLGAAFDKLDGFDLARSMARPAITKGGYRWYWTAWFFWEGGIMLAVTFPWAKDIDRKDNCSSDRMSAAYSTLENVPGNEGVLRTLSDMHRALEEYLRYHPIVR